MGNYTLPTILTDNVNVILDSIKREKDIPAELRIAIYNTVIERIKFRIHKKYTTYYMCSISWYILVDIVYYTNKDINIVLDFPMRNIYLVLPELNKKKLYAYEIQHKVFNKRILGGDSWFNSKDYESRIKWLKICINELEKNNNKSAI